MKEIYPLNYFEDKYNKKTVFGKYIHGVKFAYRNKILLKWHYNMIKMYILTKI